jgi:GT2 family glycosyltransferase
LPTSSEQLQPVDDRSSASDSTVALTTSVAVITYERPAFVARCLRNLQGQTHPPEEIVVVDSSISRETELLVAEEFPGVTYAACEAGYGAMATARDISYRMSTGDVLAFVDDDAFAEPDWLERLLPAFDDPTVGAVGGRQIRRQPGELTEGVDAIGRLLDDGTITGNFAADPGRNVEVDHLLGANMAFRRTVLDALGGIRDGYAGTCVREETDLCLRVKQAQYHLIFVPDAVVEHVAAPYAKGRRFDVRYDYWNQKNHLILLIRNFGMADPKVRRYLASSLRAAGAGIATSLGRAQSRARHGEVLNASKGAGAAVLRTVVVLAASITGVVEGVRLRKVDRRAQSGPSGSS